jgi:polysaccharide export outer membrane protein
MGLVVGLSGAGCSSQQLVADNPALPGNNQLPRELDKVSMPTYVIEPPDILLIDSYRVVPLPPYHVEPMDVLFIFCPGAPSDAPPDAQGVPRVIQGNYPVEPGGTVNLGPTYGSVKLDGMTLQEAKAALEKNFKDHAIKDVTTQVSVAQSRLLQQIRGEHLVRPDGTISLGTYGSVYVTGLSTDAAKAAIEAQLKKYLDRPEVSVDILAFNSKVFYIIADGGGFGAQIVRAPITGNETVLDAISQINGLPQQSSRKKIWIARPAPPGATTGDQILPIDYKAIAMAGRTDTNYQLLPGDRLYIMADGLVAANNWLGKVLAPIERIMGDVSLGAGAVNSVATVGRFGVNNGGTVNANGATINR